jgi:membrane-bound lytic murein transglycosylase D
MKIKIVLITLLLLTGALWLAKSSINPQKEHTLEKISEKQHAESFRPAKIPNSLYFAGEKVPVKYYDVRERLDRELLVNKFWHSSTFLLIKKANRYFPLIEKILKEENVPDDLKYIAVAESGLANVVSPSRAAGFWQFLKGAARDFNLEVNNEIDERYNIEKATRAACKYMKWNYEKFGSWAMAAAAYNYGRTAISKQIERQQCENYYDLLLPEETERYVFRLIAIKMILENPAKYNFQIAKNDLYQEIETKTVIIDHPIENLAEFAAKYDISYRMLKEFNPWLRENYLTNKQNKTYEIKIPVKHARHQYDHLSF